MRDALWTLDGMQVGRSREDGRQDLDPGREHRVRENLPAVVGEPLRGEYLVSALETSRKARGCLPLVLSTDNGLERVNATVMVWLAAR